LGSLQSQSLVISMMAVANTATMSLVSLTPVLLPAYQPDPQATPPTLFTPISVGVESSLSSGCRVGALAGGGANLVKYR
jgi:hypothetical protein